MDAKKYKNSKNTGNKRYGGSAENAESISSKRMSIKSANSKSANKKSANVKRENLMRNPSANRAETADGSDDGLLRIQKYISECGAMSRRAAERQIEAGEVTVNGRPATIGEKIDPTRDRVCVCGEPIGREARTITVMLNKPTGYITTLSDERGRRCVAELVEHFGVRLNPVGRLDKASEGLLLFTNDGELLNRLTHPRYSLPKLYHVTVGGEVSEEQLSRLRSPMVIEGYRIRPVECEVISSDDRRTVLAMTLHEGRNRQIRRMCEQVGLSVHRLIRVAVGQIKLGGLRPGDCRLLTAEQVKYLRKATGLK